MTVDVFRGSAHKRKMSAVRNTETDGRLFHFVFVRQGEVGIQSSAISLRLNSRQVAGFTSETDISYRTTLATDFVLVSMPLNDLPLHAQILRLAALDSSVTLTMLASCLEVVIANVESIDPMGTMATYSTVRHLASLLLETLDTPASGSTTFDLFEQATAIITEQAADPQFGPEVLATKLNVTLRTLQRVFASRGMTVAAALRRRRLQLIINAMSIRAAISPGEIVRASGFPNYGTAARVFKAAHGKTLTEFARSGLVVHPLQHGEK